MFLLDSDLCHFYARDNLPGRKRDRNVICLWFRTTLQPCAHSGGLWSLVPLFPFQAQWASMPYASPEGLHGCSLICVCNVSRLRQRHFKINENMFYLQVCTLCTHRNIQNQNRKYPSVKMCTNTSKMRFLENLKPLISLKRTRFVLKIIIQKRIPKAFKKVHWFPAERFRKDLSRAKQGRCCKLRFKHYCCTCFVEICFPENQQRFLFFPLIL